MILAPPLSGSIGSPPLTLCLATSAPSSTASTGAQVHIIDPERAEVAARPSGQIARAGERAAYPSTAEGPGTGTLAPFAVSIRRPERQGA